MFTIQILPENWSVTFAAEGGAFILLFSNSKRREFHRAKQHQRQQREREAQTGDQNQQSAMKGQENNFKEGRKGGKEEGKREGEKET